MKKTFEIIAIALVLIELNSCKSNNLSGGDHYLYNPTGSSENQIDQNTSNSTRYLNGNNANRSGNYAYSVPFTSVSNLSKRDSVSYWDGDGVSGSKKIVISIFDQNAKFYKGNKLVGVSTISSGKDGYDTPRGVFSIQQKSKDHRSSIYGNYVEIGTGRIVRKDIDNRKVRKPKGTKYVGTPMPYFMRINGGVGMHSGYLPGFAASHGCIRMPDHMAKIFFNNVSLGTKVIVKN